MSGYAWFCDLVFAVTVFLITLNVLRLGRDLRSLEVRVVSLELASATKQVAERVQRLIDWLSGHEDAVIDEMRLRQTTHELELIRNLLLRGSPSEPMPGPFA